MVQLDLQPQEVLLLQQVLNEYLSDLRMEISNTEQYEMRESLKRQEAALKSLIVRLGEISPVRRRMV